MRKKKKEGKKKKKMKKTSTTGIEARAICLKIARCLISVTWCSSKRSILYSNN